MEFIADVHLHSRYARATSRDLCCSALHRWAALKGIDVVGTGDCTHPAWAAELREQLVERGDGLLELRPELQQQAGADLPPLCRRPVRFVLSAEISSIYRKGGRTRKVHNLILLPDLGAMERLDARLDAVGNIRADGRPILGLDSRQVLELALEVCPDVLFIPAHIWTPHFSVLGSASGFDSLGECYEDLLPHIPAVETGLSSDPPMNWRLSQLDPFTLVSNSDAHSPQKLGREASCFAAELSYRGLSDALFRRGAARCTGTLEFYPEEGKYHYDGHRQCGVCWKPAQTLAAGGRCPRCGRPLTVGVLHRVELLADRPEGAPPPPASGACEYLIPLVEVIGAALGVGPAAAGVERVYHKLLAALGPEIDILRHAPVEAIAGCGEPLVAEGIRRMRCGQVKMRPGHDGEYGVIELFGPDERGRLTGQTTLFGGSAGVVRAGTAPAAVAGSDPGDPGDRARPAPPAPPAPSPPAARALSTGGLRLDAAQAAVARAGAGPLVVIAGPGSGKTRTLVARIVTLIGERGVRPEQILALTFTNRAAGEIRVRLRASLPSVAGLGRLFVGTFHSLALALLREAGLPCEPVLDEAEARQALALAMRLAGVAGKVRDAAQAISLAKASGDPAGALAGSPHASAWAAYQAHLAASGARDYDDVLLELRRALRADAALRVCTCERFPHVLVDEFQDVNAVQYDLVRLLAGDGGGLMVIGDPDQAIYGFRGASPRHFALLGQDFPRSQVFRLDTNYRSQPGIVATARALMGAGRPAPAPAPAGPGSGTQAQADGPVAAPVRVWRVPGETAEGIAIVREIDRLLGGADMLRADGGGAGGRSLNDFGVLFRTGAQARALEECFSRAGLPYRVLGQKAFLEADSVRAALCFARYVLDPDSFLRRAHALLQAPFRPARMAAETAWQALLAAEAGAELPPALREARARLERTARDCRDRVGDAAAFVAGWTRACGQEPDADLAELARVAAHSGSLADLLARLRWGREGDIERYGSAAAPGGEAVSLLTLHAAKGLEFPVVFICGVEEGLIPMRERGTDLEEERRLLYVGMTRARDELILLHAQSRPRRGERVRPALSSFVAELPPGLLAHEEADGQRRGRRPEQLSLF